MTLKEHLISIWNEERGGNWVVLTAEALDNIPEDILEKDVEPFFRKRGAAGLDAFRGALRYVKEMDFYKNRERVSFPYVVSNGKLERYASMYGEGGLEPEPHKDKEGVIDYLINSVSQRDLEERMHKIRDESGALFIDGVRTEVGLSYDVVKLLREPNGFFLSRVKLYQVGDTVTYRDKDAKIIRIVGKHTIEIDDDGISRVLITDNL